MLDKFERFKKKKYILYLLGTLLFLIVAFNLNLYFSISDKKIEKNQIYKYEYSFKEGQDKVPSKDLSLKPTPSSKTIKESLPGNESDHYYSFRGENKIKRPHPYLLLKEQELEDLINKFPDHFKNLSKEDYLFFIKRFPDNKELFSTKDEFRLKNEDDLSTIGPLEPASHLGMNPYLHDIEKSFQEPNFYLMLTDTDIKTLINNFPKYLKNLTEDDYNALVESYPDYKEHFSKN